MCTCRPKQEVLSKEISNYQNLPTYHQKRPTNYQNKPTNNQKRPTTYQNKPTEYQKRPTTFVLLLQPEDDSFIDPRNRVFVCTTLFKLVFYDYFITTLPPTQVLLLEPEDDGFIDPNKKKSRIFGYTRFVVSSSG